MLTKTKERKTERKSENNWGKKVGGNWTVIFNESEANILVEDPKPLIVTMGMSLLTCEVTHC